MNFSGGEDDTEATAVENHNFHLDTESIWGQTTGAISHQLWNPKGKYELELKALGPGIRTFTACGPNPATVCLHRPHKI